MTLGTVGGVSTTAGASGGIWGKAVCIFAGAWGSGERCICVTCSIAAEMESAAGAGATGSSAE